MAKERKAGANKNNEKFSLIGSPDDVLRVSVTADKSLQIRNAIIDAKKKDFGFDASSLYQNTSFNWLEQNLPEYKREEIVAALIDMDGVEILDSATGSIGLPSKYF